MRELIAAIYYEWTRKRWQPKTLNLDRHIEHMAGGAALALLFLFVRMGLHIEEEWTREIVLRWVEWSVINALMVGFAIEATTVIAKLIKGKDAFADNWRDSIFDFVQYCAVAFFVPLAYWQFGFLAATLLTYSILYFLILLKGW